MASTSSTRSAAIDPVASLMSEFELKVESTRKLTLLLDNNEKISQNIQLGMQLATDAACDAEEHNLQNEVSNLEGVLEMCININAQFAQQEDSLKQLNTSILEGHRIKNMVEYCDAHRKELEQQSASQALKRPKYKEHEAYADFKQRIWDVNHKDEEMPSSGEEDGDDDIVIGRAKVSLKCPLTTVLFEDPVTR
ncbi:E3 SUMO-protein ligase NSE2 [Umbelopsis sp. WA50703]